MAESGLQRPVVRVHSRGREAKSAIDDFGLTAVRAPTGAVGVSGHAFEVLGGSLERDVNFPHCDEGNSTVQGFSRVRVGVTLRWRADRRTARKWGQFASATTASAVG